MIEHQKEMKESNKSSYPSRVRARIEQRDFKKR